MISAEVAIRRDGERNLGSVHAAAAQRRQPGLLEDALNVQLLQNGRDDLRLATAVRAVFHVDLEHVLGPRCPTQPHRAALSVRAARTLAAPPARAAWRWVPAGREGGSDATSVGASAQPAVA
jgi:hypothetical protein